MNLTIDHDVIRALLVIAPKSDIRYYLNGICIDARESGDVTLVATDGHRLLAVPLEPDAIEGLMPGQYIIPREALESVKPCKVGKTALPMTLTIHAPEGTPDPDRPGVTMIRSARYTLTGATNASGALVDGRYPDWRKVMPDWPASGVAAQFDPAYLADWGKVCTLLAGPKQHPVIHHNGPTNSALVSHLGRNALGVIMPLRAGDAAEHPGLPDWARHTPAATAAA